MKWLFKNTKMNYLSNDYFQDLKICIDENLPIIGLQSQCPTEIVF